jgi:DNA-binding NarL/FixJ family response regulator
VIRVLIVDDHAIVRTGLSQLLGTADDLELVGATGSGADAVTLAAELRPDVVLMDLSMPGTDGISATAQIVAANPDAHVLVLT